MKKYFVKAETEWAGTQCYELIEAENEKVAEQQAQEIAMNNYESYSNIWEQEQEETEKDGFDWIDGEHYEYSMEEYNPEKHDGYLK